MAEQLTRRMTDSPLRERYRIEAGGLAVIRAMALPGLIVLVYGIIAHVGLGKVVGELGVRSGSLVTIVQVMIPLFLVAASIYGTIYLALTDTGERPFRRIMSSARSTPFGEIIVWRFLPAMGLFVMFQPLFLAVKQSIPEIAPFTWDPLLAEIDRLLFLGTDPWVISHGLLPDAIATRTFDIFYAAWFFIMLISYITASVMRLSSTTRLTFLTAFYLNWILAGSLAALVFASAGPVYMERLFGITDFAPLMERLSAQSEVLTIAALDVQEKLWRGYADPDYPATGISAFPSMHLCISMTVTLFCFALARWLGVAMALFTTVMLVASVHLGWHYLVDGLAGIALSVAIWRMSAMLARRWLARWPETA